MKNRATLTLALIALSAPLGFGHGGEEEWTAAEEAWPALDAYIASSAFSAADDGVNLSGWIKTDYRNSSDAVPNVADFSFNSVRANFTGGVGEMSYKVSVELGGGVASLRDAFVKFPVANGVTGTFGTFKSPFLFSGLSPFTGTLFYDRTSLGGQWAGRDAGIQFNGFVDRFAWTLCAQDGGDADGDDLHLTGRVTYDLYDETVGIRKWAGGYGTDGERQVTLGLSYLDEQALDDGTALALEVMAVCGPFWLHAETVDFGDGFVDGALVSGNTARSNGRAGTSPYDVTVAYALNDDYEIALRYEDFDDADGTDIIRTGVTRYLDGHGLKWQVDWASTNSRSVFWGSDAITVGLTLAW